MQPYSGGSNSSGSSSVGSTGFGTALVGGYNAGMGIFQNMLTNRYQKQASETAWQRELELYHYNNWYNSPAQQMQRYRDAGLNPALMYGLGPGTASGNATATPRYQKPDLKMKFDSDIAGTMNLMAQTGVAQANKEYIEARTQHEGQKQILTEIQQSIRMYDERIRELETSATPRRLDQEAAQRAITYEKTASQRDLNIRNLFNAREYEKLLKERQGMYGLQKMLLAQNIANLTIQNRYLPASQLTNIIAKSVGTAAGAFVGGATGMSQLGKLSKTKLPKNIGKFISANKNF